MLSRMLLGIIFFCDILPQGLGKGIHATVVHKSGMVYVPGVSNYSCSGFFPAGKKIPTNWDAF